MATVEQVYREFARLLHEVEELQDQAESEREEEVLTDALRLLRQAQDTLIKLDV